MLTLWKLYKAITGMLGNLCHQPLNQAGSLQRPLLEPQVLERTEDREPVLNQLGEVWGTVEEEKGGA